MFGSESGEGEVKSLSYSLTSALRAVFLQTQCIVVLTFRWLSTEPLPLKDLGSYSQQIAVRFPELSSSTCVALTIYPLLRRTSLPIERRLNPKGGSAEKSSFSI